MICDLIIQALSTSSSSPLGLSVTFSHLLWKGRYKRYQTGWERTDSKYKLVILVPYQLLLHKGRWGCGTEQLIKSGCHLSVKDTHRTLSRAWYDHRGQSWINAPETVFPHDSPACGQETEAPQTRTMSSSGKKNMKLSLSCHLFYSVFLPNIMAFLVSHQAYWMTQRVVINIETHSHTHTRTPCCLPWESSAGSSLTQDVLRRS